MFFSPSSSSLSASALSSSCLAGLEEEKFLDWIPWKEHGTDVAEARSEYVRAGRKDERGILTWLAKLCVNLFGVL